jgi:PPIC-type PPIASE domain
VNPALNIDNSLISGDRTIAQLHRFRLLPQLLNEIAIDDVVAEMAVAWSIDLDWTAIEFEQNYTELAISPFYQGMNERQLAAICDRELRLQKFKLAKWGDEVKAYFQDRGNGLDRVVLSVLQVESAALAQELFFRIQAQEQSFAEIALDYSHGIHADNGGILESLRLRDLNPALRGMVAKSQPGDLSPIFRLDDYYTFFRLDEWQPAQLDGQMYRFLLDELFTTWLESKLADRGGQMMNPRLMPDIHPPELPLPAERILDRLSKSPLLFQYLREVIIEETLAVWERSTEFTLVKHLVPLDVRNLPVALLQLYKQTEWGHLLNSRFLARKAQLDRVLCSAIQITDLYLAEELYCILQQRGHSFTKLASIHSQSPVAKRGGAIGPVAVCQLHPTIQDRLTGLEPNQLSPIFQLDEHYLILRLDRWLPVKFNAQTQQQLLDELFEQWLRLQIEQRLEIDNFHLTSG